MGRGFPTFLVASFIIFSLSLCQLKCWWGLILDSEQVQALAESLPRNTSFGKNFHGFLLPPATLTVQAWFCSKATVHTLTRTAECVGDKVSMLFLAGAERKAHFGTALGVKLSPKRAGERKVQMRRGRPCFHHPPCQNVLLFLSDFAGRWILLEHLSVGEGKQEDLFSRGLSTLALSLLYRSQNIFLIYSSGYKETALKPQRTDTVHRLATY